MEKTNSGISIEDSQYQICKGMYGGKKWSTSDRETACTRYEELTGKHIQGNEQPTTLALFAPLTLIICIVALVLGYLIYQKVKKQHPINNKHKK